jgi:hypothetical protein
MLAKFALSLFSAFLLVMALPTSVNANHFASSGSIQAKPRSLPGRDSQRREYYQYDHAVNLWTWYDVSSRTRWYYTQRGWMTEATLARFFQNSIDATNNLIRALQSSGQSTAHLQNHMLTLRNYRDVMSKRW